MQRCCQSLHHARESQEQTYQMAYRLHRGDRLFEDAV
jgi:hypothetical protein